MKHAWPDSTERSILGRFYLADGLRQSLDFIYPFHFVYLYLSLENPAWAPIPVLFESAAYLFLEIPTGLLADRWSRKGAVIIGYILGSFAWFFVPLAVRLEGHAQLVAVCCCFFVGGVAATMVSGAAEAWVVDNLHESGRADLIDIYFARLQVCSALGSTVAACFVLLLLLNIEVSQVVLGGLWQVMALGMVLSAAILTTAAEPPLTIPGLPAKKIVPFKTTDGFRFLLKKPALLLFFFVLVIGSFAGSITDEAFDISLVIRGMDARAFAVLAIADNLVWIFAPVVGVSLAHKWGVQRVLTLFLILPALATCLFFLEPGLGSVIMLYLVLDLFDGIWDPLAKAHFHSLIPSNGRATMVSMVNQAGGLVELAGIGLFAWMLGGQVDNLQSSVPDLLEAFSGGVVTLASSPMGFLGIPLSDQAIVFFILSGLLAVPLLLFNKSGGDSQKFVCPETGDMEER